MEIVIYRYKAEDPEVKISLSTLNDVALLMEISHHLFDLLEAIVQYKPEGEVPHEQ